MLNNTHFDYLAETYDTDFTHSAIGNLQRQLVWKHTKTYLSDSSQLDILEINCGTGEDAVWMASMGHRVLATDISPKMIAVTQQKIREKKLFIETQVLGFHELANHLSNRKFDLIFSDFAGLNCVDDEGLKKLNFDFAKLLKPSGKLIMIVLGKKCLSEKLYFLLKSDFKNLNRRKKVASAYLSSGNYISTYYYSWQEIKTIFTAFRIIEKKPIGLFIPPSYLEKAVKNKITTLKIIFYLDKIFTDFQSFSNLSDHTFLVLEKKY